MPIPDFQSCMRPLLASIADGKVHHFNSAFDQVCHFFNLSDEEMREYLPSGKQTIIRNRIGWSRTYLKKAGLLIQPERGHIQITDLGLEALKTQPVRIDVKYLKRFDAFKQFHTYIPSAAISISDADDQGNTDPVERLEEAYAEIQQELIDEVLSTAKQQPPQFLETLVVQLMQAMGYGGWSESSGTTTPYTADGGIDGIINEDPLGLDSIYLQAKRYTSGKVGRPEIQAFVGALEMKRARKGVFITTSQFSADASEYISFIEKKIVLIDGVRLAELMVKHNLGVTAKETYQVKTLDSDFFDSN